MVSCTVETISYTRTLHTCYLDKYFIEGYVYRRTILHCDICECVFFGSSQKCERNHALHNARMHIRTCKNAIIKYTICCLNVKKHKILLHN